MYVLKLTLLDDGDHVCLSLFGCHHCQYWHYCEQNNQQQPKQQQPKNPTTELVLLTVTITVTVTSTTIL